MKTLSQDKLGERRCAICGRAQQDAPSLGGIAAFTIPLRGLGIKGSYAHPSCLSRKQRAEVA
jgi:hypothetical protein